MAVIPTLGRNHFFALYSVLGSVALGLSPILWGLLIDAAGKLDARGLGLVWDRYMVFFAAVWFVMALAALMASRLHEPKAASMESLLREILIDSPQRVWVRLWPRP
jgi:MFS-type transporter involved in bile tolerance (Atg22 family)